MRTMPSEPLTARTVPEVSTARVSHSGQGATRVGGPPSRLTLTTSSGSRRTAKRPPFRRSTASAFAGRDDSRVCPRSRRSNWRSPLATLAATRWSSSRNSRLHRCKATSHAAVVGAVLEGGFFHHDSRARDLLRWDIAHRDAGRGRHEARRARVLGTTTPRSACVSASPGPWTRRWTRSSGRRWTASRSPLSLDERNVESVRKVCTALGRRDHPRGGDPHDAAPSAPQGGVGREQDAVRGLSGSLRRRAAQGRPDGPGPAISGSPRPASGRTPPASGRRGATAGRGRR